MAYAYVSRHSVGRQVLGRAIRIHALDLDLALDLVGDPIPRQRQEQSLTSCCPPIKVSENGDLRATDPTASDDGDHYK